MVLNSGRLNVEKLMGGSVEGLPVVKIAVGTGNAPVTANDTTLTNSVVKPVEDVNYLANNIVEFRGTLAADDPAMTIQEVGIMDANNVLLFRKVISPRVKTTGVTASVYYRVKIQ